MSKVMKKLISGIPAAMLAGAVPSAAGAESKKSHYGKHRSYPLVRR